jgi:uncharacterized ParB-like nuclease family protein
MKFDFSEEAKLTNSQLAQELSAITPLTMSEIDALLPKKADKQKLQQLIEIVGSGASQNNKVAELTNNISELGGVVVKVVGKLLKIA